MSDEIEKLKMHSPDLTAQNIDRIAALFPGCVTEGAGPDGTPRRMIDFDLLRQELSDSIVDGPQERYHLDWPGKRQALITANAPIAKTLRPVRDESVDFDTTRNLFIEGDNLEALKLLQETYLGKVKMIYIDPPYNTGNDFVYDDDFAESAAEFLAKSNQVDEAGNRLVANTQSNGRFHSDWLSMMYARLKLARNLLSDDGVIFISIDDGELNGLLGACNEIFGEENKLGVIAVVSNLKGRSDDKYYATAHNYLLAYKRRDFVSLGVPLPEEYKKDYSEQTEDGRLFRLQGLRKRGDSARRIDRPNMFFPIYGDPKNGSVSLEGSEEYSVEILPFLSDGQEGRWRWGKETVSSRLNELCCREVGKDSRLDVFQIDFAEGAGGAKRIKPKSFWEGSEFSNEAGSLELKRLFSEKVFETPKPTGLLRYCLEHATQNDDLILDFFAGSATSADAMLAMNASDGGRRRFIMVQLPEVVDKKSEAFKAGFSTIAEISKERIRRAGAKILEGECHPDWNRDVGFRVLKIDSSNMADVYYTPDATTQADLLTRVDNIKQGRTSEDLLFQVLLDWGVDLTLPITRETVEGKTVFTVAGTALIACFDNGVDEALVKTLAARKPLRVVFKDTGFKDDATKINVKQIFKSRSPDTDVKAI